jgi:RNA polymerase sigma-70 factor, ECF subfamily
VTTNRQASTRRAENSSNDGQLASEAVGSPDSFGQLYERYLDVIFTYCLRRVDDPQTAEDITASIFERSYAQISTFRGGSFRAWLFRIAHNAVTDHYRRRRNIIPWKPEMSGADDDPSPEEHAIATEQAARIYAYLAALTDDQRRVVELRLSGLTGAEIAEVLDRSPDAVKMLQYRALQRIRDQISTDPASTELTDE